MVLRGPKEMMSDIPKVLLLGDSIRMSYQPHIARLLDGRAHVVGPSDNCQYSSYTLASLDRWIGELGCPEIIHWNNGIHDAGHNPARTPVQIPIAMYRANLEIILNRLTVLTSNVIWATTTPVHPNRPFLNTEWAWRNEEIDQFNEAARELMESRGVRINDLYTVVWDNVAEFLSEDQLHLSEAGQKMCARACADSILTFLPRP
jgi:isoamyl acetate esterase